MIARPPALRNSSDVAGAVTRRHVVSLALRQLGEGGFCPGASARKKLHPTPVPVVAVASSEQGKPAMGHGSWY